jgi:hypothetical protein
LFVAPDEVNPLVQVLADVLALKGLYSSSGRKSSCVTVRLPPDSTSRRGTDLVWPMEVNQRRESSR